MPSASSSFWRHGRTCRAKSLYCAASMRQRRNKAIAPYATTIHLRLGRLLLRQDGAEHGLLDVGLERARGGIDERVGGALLQLGEFLQHVVLGAVIAELHFAGQRAHLLERA